MNISRVSRHVLRPNTDILLTIVEHMSVLSKSNINRTSNRCRHLPLQHARKGIVGSHQLVVIADLLALLLLSVGDMSERPYWLVGLYMC